MGGQALDAVFPYASFRRGQRELAEAVEKAVREGSILTVKAPTGFGKTAAVIYGLLRSEVDHVMYLVRTVNELDPVLRELKRFSQEFTILFSARRACPFMAPGRGAPVRLPPEDFWENCRVARSRMLCGYYETAESLDPEAVRSVVSSSATHSGIRLAWDVADRLGSCPFFSFRSIASSSKFIVATYPYFFRRDIFEFALEGLSYEDLVVVVDEAHSLMNAQSLLEKRITVADVENSIREVKQYTPGYESVLETLDALRSLLASHASRPGRSIEKLDKSEFISVIGDLEPLLDAAEEVRFRIAEENLLLSSSVSMARTSITRVAGWAEVLLMDETLLFRDPSGRSVQFMATPLDPTVIVKEPLERTKAAILMSGTIPEPSFARDVLGLEKSHVYLDVEMTYGRVIPVRNTFTIVQTDVTSMYRERSPGMYKRIAEYLALILSVAQRPVLAVYPSYDFMQNVVNKLPAGIPVLTEDKSSSLEDIEEEIRQASSVLVNAVAGGKLVEGVEFTDNEGRNLLSIVAIVGVPFPQPDDMTRSQLEILAQRIGEKKARDYVYMHKTIIRIKQALGRAVRGPEDRALYILMDRRYLRKDIKLKLNIPVNKLSRTRHELKASISYGLEFLSII